MPFEPGLYPDVDPDTHFADGLCPLPSLRQSLIPTLITKSPKHAAYRHPRLNPYGDPDAGDRARWLGSAVHRIALGRGREISVIRYRDYKEASAREARDLAVANNRIPVLERDYLQAQDMAEIVKQRIREALDGADYLTEVPFYWLEESAAGPVWCGGMLDVWCPAKATALDVKALRTPATPEAFGRVSASFGFDIQDGFYTRGLGKILPALEGRLKFFDLPVETLPPFEAATLELDEGSRHVVHQDIKAAIEIWGKCVHLRSWPGYPRSVQKYSTPPYHQQAAMSRAYSEDAY